jgi:predicted ATPase
MIKEFYLDNFKSLVDFRIQLTRFTSLIGLNGSGKSTILQAIDFISQLAQGNLDDWLEAREWQASDLASQLKHSSTILFEVKFQVDDTLYAWEGQVDLETLTCTKEIITNEAGKTLLKVTNGLYCIGDNPAKSLEFKYQGSALSAIIDKFLSEELKQIRCFLTSIKSLDLLNPQLMRKRARKSDNDLGLGGEKLSAFLHNLSENDRTELIKQLHKQFSPTFKSFETSTKPPGWKKLLINEKFPEGELIKTEATHVSDGLLRLLAILSQMMTSHSVLLFDEIEDGINSELVETLVDWLVTAPNQVIITTHSPMILNYIEDERAKESVILTYKNKRGATQQRRFFSIEGIGEKLESLAAGEAMVDINLSKLVEALTHD